MASSSSCLYPHHPFYLSLYGWWWGPNFPFCPSCTYVHKASLQMLGSLLSWWVDSFSFDMVFLFSSFSNSSATPSTTFVSHSLPLVLLPRTRIPFVDLAGILVVNPVKSTLGEEVLFIWSSRSSFLTWLFRFFLFPIFLFLLHNLLFLYIFSLSFAPSFHNLLFLNFLHRSFRSFALSMFLEPYHSRHRKGGVVVTHDGVARWEIL